MIKFTPLPIRYIRNNTLRRLAMVSLFPIYISIGYLGTFVILTSRWLLSFITVSVGVWRSMVEFWNEPDVDKLKDD